MTTVFPDFLNDADDSDEDDEIDSIEDAEARLRAWEERDRAEQAKERAEEAAAEAQDQAQKKLYVETLTDMMTTPLESKAKAQISLLTHAMFECMTEATMMSPRDQPAPPPNVWKAPDARNTVRHTELTDMARLSEASARMLDAYTRFRRANNHDLQFQQLTRRKMKDGSVQQTMIRHLGRTTPMDDFVVTPAEMAAARKRADDEKAAAQSAGS
jgi:hypothetical protein